MAREKPLTSRANEARVIAQATELGKQLGEYKGQKKKPLEVSLKEHIGKFIDNLKVSDVIEISAWLALAYLIKPIFEGDAVSRKAVADLTARVSTGDIKSAWRLSQLLSHPFLSKEEQKEAQEYVDTLTALQINFWLLALGTSALIMKFGPSILQSMGGVTKIGSLLLQ